MKKEAESDRRNTGNVLGFDFGLKHIGVAVGELSIALASPIKILSANDGVPDWQVVGELIESWRPHRLLVGLPLNMDGSESELSARAKKFANRLHGRYGLPVSLVDERLSSVEARQILSELEEQGGKKRRQQRTGSIDALAAKLIVDTWLASGDKKDSDQ